MGKERKNLLEPRRKEVWNVKRSLKAMRYRHAVCRGRTLKSYAVKGASGQATCCMGRVKRNVQNPQTQTVDECGGRDEEWVLMLPRFSSGR